MRIQFQPRDSGFGVLLPDPVRWSHRPACLALVSIVTVLSLCAGLLSTRNQITGDFSQGLAPRRWLRDVGIVAGLPALGLGGVIAPTMGELLLFGGVVLMAGTAVETVIGTQRLAALVGFLMLLRVPLVATIATVLPWTHTNAAWYATSPSVAWLGISLAVVRRLVSPPSRAFEAFGVPMCDQTATDFLALQMALMSSRGVVAEGLLGVVAPCIALADIVGFSRKHPNFFLPGIVRRMIAQVRPDARVVFARDIRFATHGARQGGSADAGAQEGGGSPARMADTAAAAAAGDRAAPTPGAAPVATGAADDDRHVPALQELGFSEGQCRAALRQARGDPNRASVLLLDGDIPHDA